MKLIVLGFLLIFFLYLGHDNTFFIQDEEIPEASSIIYIDDFSYAEPEQIRPTRATKMVYPFSTKESVLMVFATLIAILMYLFLSIREACADEENFSKDTTVHSMLSYLVKKYVEDNKDNLSKNEIELELIKIEVPEKVIEETFKEVFKGDLKN